MLSLPLVWEGESIMDLIAERGLVAPFDPIALSAEERVQARQIANATNALLLKGLFHRVHPERYHISPNHDSLESRVAAAIGAIPSHRFARMLPKIEALRTNPVRTAECLGVFANLDIRSSGLDALLWQVAPHLVRGEAQPLASQGVENIDRHPHRIFCLVTLMEPDVDDPEVAGVLTQVLTAIAHAAASFNGERGATFAALMHVVDLVLSLFFDNGAPHEFARVQGWGRTG